MAEEHREVRGCLRGRNLDGSRDLSADSRFVSDRNEKREFGKPGKSPAF